MAKHDDVPALKELAELSFARGDDRKALQAYRSLLFQTLDEGAPITKAEVFLRLAEVHLRLGEQQSAIEMLRRAEKADPRLERARQLLAETLATAGDLEAIGVGVAPEDRLARTPAARWLMWLAAPPGVSYRSAAPVGFATPPGGRRIPTKSACSSAHIAPAQLK